MLLYNNIQRKCEINLDNIIKLTNNVIIIFNNSK